MTFKCQPTIFFLPGSAFVVIFCSTYHISFFQKAEALFCSGLFARDDYISHLRKSGENTSSSFFKVTLGVPQMEVT